MASTPDPVPGSNGPIWAASVAWSSTTSTPVCVEDLKAAGRSSTVPGSVDNVLVVVVTFADEVRTRLTELDRPRLARFAVACAARMEPVFTTFWRSTRPGAYRNWIDELWSNVDEFSLDLAESVIESVMETPESMVDDSNRPDYYAMRVLGSVVYAAQTMTDDDPLKAAMSASSTTVSVLRDFDHALAGGHRSLADAELAAQRADLERLVAGTGEALLLAARSSALYSELGLATQGVTEINDWDLSGRPD